jgi:hypothetical protein
VLACVPGIDADTAAKLVRERANVDDDTKLTICWPVISGVLTEDQFQRAAGHLTMRSTQWRVIVEAGMRDGTTGAELTEADRAAGADEKPLLDQVTVEAVIDVSGTRPRVAYLRDISLLLVAQSLDAIRRARMDTEESRWRGTSETDIPKAQPAPATTERVPGERRDLPAGPNRAEFRERASRPEQRTRTTPKPSEEPPEADVPDDGAEAAPPEPAEDEVDTRLGRWRVGNGDQSTDSPVDSQQDSIDTEDQ